MSLTGHWNASLLPRGIERGGRLKSMHSGATMVHGDGYSNVTAYTIQGNWRVPGKAER